MQRKFDDFILSQVIDKDSDDLIVLGARPAIGKSTLLLTKTSFAISGRTQRLECRYQEKESLLTKQETLICQ